MITLSMVTVANAWPYVNRTDCESPGGPPGPDQAINAYSQQLGPNDCGEAWCLCMTSNVHIEVSCGREGKDK